MRKTRKFNRLQRKAAILRTEEAYIALLAEPRMSEIKRRLIAFQAARDGEILPLGEISNDSSLPLPLPLWEARFEGLHGRPQSRMFVTFGAAMAYLVTHARAGRATIDEAPFFKFSAVSRWQNWKLCLIQAGYNS